MTLMGLDLNATRARAVLADPDEFPLPYLLDPPAQELPLVLSLENHTPHVGRPGSRLQRFSPHLTVHNFLHHVGVNHGAQRYWKAGRIKLDAAAAMKFVWQHLQPLTKHCEGVALCLPSYLSSAQAELLRQSGEKHLPIFGSLGSLLALASAGHAEQAWFESALVVDIDDFAMSVGLVQSADKQIKLIELDHFPDLGMFIWKRRLLDAIADRCVHQSRRDPRCSALAEQGLFENLDALLETTREGRPFQIGIQASQWYQNLEVSPEDTVAFCRSLANRSVARLNAFVAQSKNTGTPGTILASASTARLPGFVDLLGVQHTGLNAEAGEDFGESLLDAVATEWPGIALLTPDAAARAAHGLGGRFESGQLPRHLERSAPVPATLAEEAGPPRLYYQGREFLLTHEFMLGAQPSCQIVFDKTRFPMVEARHCEIYADNRSFVLLNRSEAGTLLNDAPVQAPQMLRPGDRLRLTATGPAIRFLGHA